MTPFPSKEQVLAFVRDSAGPVGKREIARAFGVRGAGRARLNGLLKELRAEGALGRGRGRAFGRAGALPGVMVIEIAGTDRDGDPVARPAAWTRDGAPPSIHPVAAPGKPAPGVGDRILARLSPAGDGSYVAREIKRLESAPRRVLGVLEGGPEGLRVAPVDRRARTELAVAPGAAGGAAPGELVVAETDGGRRPGLPRARILERVGAMDAPGAPSLVALRRNGIPEDFPADALAEAAAAEPPSPEGRVDLRDVPLVTIDGEDARDFDDAVWADEDRTGGNPGGWRLIVAIADVAWHVRPGSALDAAARERGNSVYLPDRAVPMLPEALSGDLCSLMPGRDRGCVAARLRIDRDGELVGHDFVRGLMRSAARLTYEEAEDLRGGRGGGAAADAAARLHGAWEALRSARERRGALDLDLPERRVLFDEDGTVAGFAPLRRRDSHRVIEEFMIAANVAAAETLARRGAPCLFRVHDEPPPEKIEGLRRLLRSSGIPLAKGQVLRARTFQRILEQAAALPESETISLAVLRAQARAEYAPRDAGHFGLGLRRYAHFTSPIRRYSDLLVHRSLIAARGLGAGGLEPGAGERFAEWGRHLSMTERRAADAEREAMDRYAAAHLSGRVGAVFAARVSGVHRAGLFVALEETGADGLVPMSMLGDERFVLDEDMQLVSGESSGVAYRTGDRVSARLEEADVRTGSLVFSLADGRRPRPRGRRPRRGGHVRADARRGS